MKQQQQNTGTETWQEKLQDFYKIRGKFSQNADLIRRVMSKVNQDVVLPLREQNRVLLEALEGVMRFESSMRLSMPKHLQYDKNFLLELDKAKEAINKYK